MIYSGSEQHGCHRFNGAVSKPPRQNGDLDVAKIFDLGANISKDSMSGRATAFMTTPPEANSGPTLTNAMPNAQGKLTSLIGPILALLFSLRVIVPHTLKTGQGACRTIA